MGEAHESLLFMTTRQRPERGTSFRLISLRGGPGVKVGRGEAEEYLYISHGKPHSIQTLISISCSHLDAQFVKAIIPPLV